MIINFKNEIPKNFLNRVELIEDEVINIYENTIKYNIPFMCKML